MEIRTNTYIEASRVREAGLTEEMIEDKISNFYNFDFDEPVWWVDSDLDLRSYRRTLKEYTEKYAPGGEDVTDEFIEWLKPSKKEFDVHEAGWCINHKDLNLKDVLQWLEYNTDIVWYHGGRPTDSMTEKQAILLDEGWEKPCYLNAYSIDCSQEHPSTPEALAFFKEKLNTKTEQGVTLTLSMLREIAPSGGFNIEQIRKAGFNIDNLLLPENIDITQANYTHYRWYTNIKSDLVGVDSVGADCTAKIIAKYGKTSLAEKPIKQESKGVPILNTAFKQQQYECIWEGTEPKQKHKAFNKYFK